jgi:hypothetical protein
MGEKTVSLAKDVIRTEYQHVGNWNWFSVSHSVQKLIQSRPQILM